MLREKAISGPFSFGVNPVSLQEPCGTLMAKDLTCIRRKLQLGGHFQYFEEDIAFEERIPDHNVAYP